MCSFSGLLLIGLFLIFVLFLLHIILISGRPRLLLLGLSLLLLSGIASALIHLGLIDLGLLLVLLWLSWLAGVGLVLDLACLLIIAFSAGQSKLGAREHLDVLFAGMRTAPAQPEDTVIEEGLVGIISS